MATTKLPVEIDESAYPQDFLDIKYTMVGSEVEYTVTVAGPDSHTLYTLVSKHYRDKSSISRAIAREMSKDIHFGFGRDQIPYRWEENRWVNVEKWFGALDDSLHHLIQTAKQHAGGSDSLMSETMSTWQSKSRYPMEGLNLRAFGDCPGIPFSDAVMCLEFGKMTPIKHEPRYMNTRVLPITVQEAFDNYLELALGEHQDSLLMSFLHSSLDNDQLIAIRRWFGYHLLSSKLPNAERMVYLYGTGANGKSQILWLIRGLVSKDACAELRLVELKIPSNVEQLQGRLAMIGSEASSKTELDILKTLISREPLNCNPKYRDPYRIQPECLITQSSNYPPRFEDSSDAMVRRTIALHLKNSFIEAEKRVEDISDQIIKREYALLVGFALMGAQEISEMGRFDVPDSIRTSSEIETSKSNPFAAFGALLEFGPFQTEERELYEAYRRWSLEEGMRQITAQAFKDGLKNYAAKKKNRLETDKRLSDYKPSTWCYPRDETSYVCASLANIKSRPYGYRGVRFAEGFFGSAIGHELAENSQSRLKFETKILDKAE